MNKELGKIAYEAYCADRNWKSVKGERLPHFEEQSEELQGAWCKAAQAVASKIMSDTSPG